MRRHHHLARFLQSATLTVAALSLAACSLGERQAVDARPTSASKEESVLQEDVSTSAIKQKDDSATFGPTRRFSPDNFMDRTADYGLEGVSAWRNYVVDFDHDGALDLVTLDQAYGIPQFWRFHPGTQKFIKLTYSPFEQINHYSFLVFADFNRDQVPDLLAITLNQKTELQSAPVRLYQAQLRAGKLSYREIPDAFKNTKGKPVASVSVLDFNLDGHLDVFLANWVSEKDGVTRPVPDQLFQGETFIFKDISHLLSNEGLEKNGQYPNAVASFGSSTCDMDQNGFPDILLAANSGHPNKLWMNRKQVDEVSGRMFENMAQKSEFDQDADGRLSLLGAGHSQFAVCADYNNDTIMDASVGEIAHYYDPPSRDRSSILTGASLDYPPKFIRTEYHSIHHLEKWNQSDRRAVWLDYNADGLQDLLIENSGHPPHTRLILFEQEKDHSYSDVAEHLGINIMNPSGAVKADFNGDGLMDILVGQNNLRLSHLPTRAYLFENTSRRHGRRSISIHLKGESANSMAIGALVLLKTAKTTYRQWHELSYGPLNSQHTPFLYQGLGEELPEYLEVRWPILLKNQQGRDYPLVRRYDLSKFIFQGHLELTICENGRYKSGRDLSYCP